MENFLISLAVIVLVIAIIRELTCWYFKFTAILERLTEIRDLLKEQQAIKGG